MQTQTNTNANIFKLTATALLIAIGVIIPMTFPRIKIPPASYTLASHVVIFLGMFISVKVAVAVALGTTIGFFLGGFPVEIVFRALSHVVWVAPFAWYLTKVDRFNLSFAKLRVISVLIAIVHGVAEFAVIAVLFFGGRAIGDGTLFWIVSFVGLGTAIHSLVDFEIAMLIQNVLNKNDFFRRMV